MVSLVKRFWSYEGRKFGHSTQSQYSENTLMDIPSSVVQMITGKHNWPQDLCTMTLATTACSHTSLLIVIAKVGSGLLAF